MSSEAYLFTAVGGHPDTLPTWEISDAVRVGQVKGLKISARVSTAKWSTTELLAIDTAIESLASSGQPFTSDDIWQRLPGVTVTKGMGARLGSFARRGIIKNVGYAKSARSGSHGHGQTLTLWINV